MKKKYLILSLIIVIIIVIIFIVVIALKNKNNEDDSTDSVDYSNYDNNDDGYIDGVWLIYNANNYNEVYNNQEFWAYTYVTENTPNITNPTFCRYANASQIFLYADNNLGLDAHTLIHETGHFLVARLCKIKVNEF